MPEWTWAGAAVPGLRGQGLNLAAPADRDRIETGLRAAGFTIRVVEGAPIERRSALTAITRALKVQIATNLDSFADVLRDVRDDASGSGRVALLWPEADRLAAADLWAWTEIAQLLAGASAEHWDPDDDADPDNLVFETIALVAGFGVEPLA